MSTVAPPRPRAHARRRGASVPDTTARLGHYDDRSNGAPREIVSLPAAGGSRLLVDRLLGTRDDARLVAHLAADEPPENARLICAMYLADERRGTCRPLCDEDFELAAIDDPAPDDVVRADESLRNTDGFAYAIDEVATNGSIPELRWIRTSDPHCHASLEVMSLREVIGRFEDYEPMRSITARALAAHARDARVSTVTLRGELARLNASRIVLNRGLREAVADCVAHGTVTMSGIALRCDRVKRDARGNVAGETSWLGRRVGLLPESGKDVTTPWVHSDVLALIARQGLSLSPHEVEL
jgi:hypothetical protein